MLGLGLIFLACLTWALDTLIRYPMLGKLGAQSIVMFEHLVLTLIFLPMLWRAKSRLADLKIGAIFNFLIIGAMGSALATLAFTEAFRMISPSMVILLQKFQPLVAIVLARIVLKERLSKAFILWALLCFIGGILLGHKDILPGLRNFDFALNLFWNREKIGYLLTIVAVVSWGASTVFGKKLSLMGYNEKEIMAGRFLTGFVVLLPLYRLSENDLTTMMNFDIWSKLLVMALLSGLVGMAFYYQGLKRLSARQCTLAELFFPLCAVLVNWIFLEITLDPIQLAGGGLLLLGSTVIQLKHY